tara:strand:- start:254 stop:625 length:372 start_codon:yes stop_codon:yes gene_type:complete
MALTSTKFANAVSSKVLNDANMTNTSQLNVVDGAGSLYSCKIVNSNNAAVFIKLVFGYVFTVGSTAPDLVLSCPASSTYEYEIPGGVPFTALSICATENATPSDNTAPSVSGNEKIDVTLVVG